MVKIPTYEISGQQVERSAGGAAPTIEQATVGTRAVTALGNAGVELQKEQERRDAAIFAINETSNMQLEQLKKFEQRKTSGGDINNFTADIEKQFDDDLIKARERSPNEFATELLNERATSLKTNLLSDAIKFQSSQKIALAKDGFKGSTDALANSIMVDSSKFADAVKQFEGNLAASSTFFTPEEKAEARKNGVASLLKARVLSDIEGDKPEEAEKLLKTQEFISGIPADDFLTLQRNIATKKEQLKEKKLEADAATAIQNALNGTAVPIDPTNSTNKKAANAYFKATGINDKLTSLNPEGATGTVLFAQRTGILPETAEGTIRYMVRSGNNEQKAYAADIITRLQEVSPRSLDNFSEREIGGALLATSYIRAGTSVGTAIENAEKEVDPLNKDIVDTRKSFITKEYKNHDYANDVVDLLDNEIFGEPDMPAAQMVTDRIVSEYKTLFEENYKATGDEDVAKKMADTQFQRFYGTTRVDSSKRVMKYPPENFYSIPSLSDKENSKWMKRQFKNDLKEISDKLPDKETLLVADSQTAREASTGRPSYMVLVQEKSGAWTELRDKQSNILRYTFDPEKKAKEIQKEREEENAAIKKRQKLKENMRGSVK